MRKEPKHLAFVRKLPCCKCFTHPVEAAHIRIGSDGGMGLKPSDKYAVPLCHSHHREQHNIGERGFWKDMNRPHDLASQIYGTKDLDEATQIVWKFYCDN